MNRKEFSDTT